MKIWKLSLSLAVSVAAYAQGSNIQYDNGVFMPTNPLPSCTGSYQAWNQTATFNWTLWCYDSNNNSKAIRSAPLTATGSGGCPTLSSACSAPNGSTAPTFTPRSQLNSGTYSMWIDLGTNTVNPVMPPFLYTCGVATTSSAGDPPANRAAPQPSICTCDPYNPTCKSTSPIVIDVTGEGFFMTDFAHGVQFRRGPASPLEQFSWTDPAHHNAWLVRPNPDGSVTSMSMNMFGNLSPQAPPSSSPNGYSALAYWAANAGCGELKKLDANACPEVWKSLMLWHDANQNGIAEPGELVTLQDAGLYGISLDYHESQYVDAYGNMFEYRAQDWDSSANANNRSYDVFLVHR